MMTRSRARTAEADFVAAGTGKWDNVGSAFSAEPNSGTTPKSAPDQIDWMESDRG